MIGSGSREHLTACTSCTPYRRTGKECCGYDCEQLLLALDHSEELFPKLRTPTGLMVQAIY